MKIVLNSDGVRALIQHDPEGTVELAKYAASQVAHDITKTCVKEKIEERIKNIIPEMLVRDRWSSVLSEQARVLLDKEIEKKIDSKLDFKVDSVQYQEMRATIREILQKEEEKMLSVLSAKIDDLIRVRFAAAFGQEK